MSEAIKILVVEDEKIIAMDLKQTLSKLGYRVTSSVRNAVDAIQKADVDKPDVILMDIMLDSFLNGIEAAKIINSKNRIPLIFITAYSDEHTIKKVMTSRFFDYIIKPFDEITLKEKIESAMKKKPVISK